MSNLDSMIARLPNTKTRNKIREYLFDDYGMTVQEVGHFMAIMPTNLVSLVTKNQITIREVVDPIIKWGNWKTLQCASKAYQLNDKIHKNQNLSRNRI